MSMCKILDIIGVRFVYEWRSIFLSDDVRSQVFACVVAQVDISNV